MKHFILILLATTLVAGVIGPEAVFADRPGVGVSVVTNQNTEVVLLRHWIDEATGKRMGEYQATIDSAPNCMPDLVTPIDSRWYYDASKNEWYSGTNLFSVTVKDSKVTVVEPSSGQKMTFDPTVLVGSKDTKSVVKSGMLLFVDPVNENYRGNVLMWSYPDCIRYLRIIEGMLIEEFIFETDPGANVQIKSNLYKDPNFVWNRPPYAYDAVGNPLEISEDKVVLASEFAKAVYPVTIDPTTTFYTSASDGTVYVDGPAKGSAASSWSSTHDASSGDVGQGSVYAYVKVATNYYAPAAWYTDIFRAFVFFDTAAIPDGSSITSANLQLYVVFKITNLGAFDTIIQGGMPTYPHDPVVVGDYKYSWYSGDYGQLNSGSITTGQYNTWTLTASGKSAINKAGTTKFVLREEQHDEDNVAPSYGDYLYNLLHFYTYEKGAGYRPKLVVTYTAFDAPTVTTNDATLVTTASARLNSYLNSDGGEPCEVRFEYDTDSGAPYALNTSWEEGYTTGQSPYEDVGSLASDTPYYFRVQARNSEDTTSGSEKTFTTEAEVTGPSDLLANAISANEISLKWIKEAGSAETKVLYKVGSYPVDYNDGENAYFGTESVAIITGLKVGTTYYIRAWGHTAGEYSTGNSSDMATTLSGPAVLPGPSDPDQPDNWFGETDYTVMSEMPFYALVNDFIDAFSVPRNTGWMVLALLSTTALGAGVFVFSRGRSFVALAAVCAAIVILSIMRLLPLWTIVPVVVIGGGGLYVGRRG